MLYRLFRIHPKTLCVGSVRQTVPGDSSDLFSWRGKKTTRNPLSFSSCFTLANTPRPPSPPSSNPSFHPTPTPAGWQTGRYKELICWMMLNLCMGNGWVILGELFRSQTCTVLMGNVCLNKTEVMIKNWKSESWLVLRGLSWGNVKVGNFLGFRDCANKNQTVRTVLGSSGFLPKNLHYLNWVKRFTWLPNGISLSCTSYLSAGSRWLSTYNWIKA